MVLDDVTFIAGAFGIPLVKAAFTSIFASTINLITVIYLEGRRLLAIVKRIDMFSALILFAEVFAGDGSYAGASVHDQSLGL